MKNQKLYDHLKSKDPQDLNPIDKDMLRDWGNEDIYGPWTEHQHNDLDASVGFKFYKSYYLTCMGDESVNIDTTPFKQITDKWRKVFKVPVGTMSAKKAKKRLSELRNMSKDPNMPIDFSDTKELAEKISNMLDKDKNKLP